MVSFYQPKTYLKIVSSLYLLYELFHWVKERWRSSVPRLEIYCYKNCPVKYAAHKDAEFLLLIFNAFWLPPHPSPWSTLPLSEQKQIIESEVKQIISRQRRKGEWG